MYAQLAQLKDFFRSVRLEPIHLVLPAILALISSVFEGLSIGLLIPAIRGLIEPDLGFMNDLPVLGTWARLFPGLLVSRRAVALAFLVGLIFFAALAKNIFQYASSLGVQLQVRRFASNLRKLLYERYLSFGKLFFDEHSLGHLHQVLAGYSGRIAEDVKGIHTALTSFFTFFIYLVMMFLISWKLTLLAAAAYPVLLFSVKWLMGRIRKTSDFFAQTYSDLSRQISNALSCIPLVKAYTNEETEKERFNRMSDVVGRLEFSIDKKELLVYPVHEIVTLFIFFILLGGTGILMLRDRAGDIAGYLIFFFVLRRSLTNFGFASRLQATFASLHGPIREILQVLNDENKHYVPDGARMFAGLKDKIEFRGLSFSYPRGVRALKDVTFSVRKGETTALVGASGAGKTTLVNILMRFYDCPSDSVFIDGVDIRNFTVKSLRGSMAYVSQDTFLFNDTLRNNLAYGLNGRVSDQSLKEVVIQAKLDDFIRNLPDGLDTVIGDRGIKLSGGERQRVSIARAMLKGAEVLILDEATSAVDTPTEKLIQKAVEELISGKTCIVIAHRLSSIRNADKVALLNQGEVIEELPFQDFLRTKGASYDCIAPVSSSPLMGEVRRG